MKLTKYKVGLLSLAIFLSVGMLLGVNSAVLAATTHTVDDESEFQSLTGNYLSEEEIDGVNIGTGDTIVLDFEEAVQTTSLIVDVDVTIKPSDNFETVTLKQGDSPSGPSWSGNFRGEAGSSNDELAKEVDAAIVVLSNGVTLDSLVFMPSSDPNGKTPSSFVGPANAVEVDCCVTDASKMLRFHNLLLPCCGSGGGFINGFKFDASVEGTSCGTGGLDYDGKGISFKDVRIQGDSGAGIYGNGVVFTDQVGDVANVYFEEFYAGYIEDYPTTDWPDIDPSDPKPADTDPTQDGNGILFNNNGYVKNVTLTKSERTSPSVSELPFAIEENASDGIMVNGESVTKVSGLELDYTRLEKNGGAGIFVSGLYSGSLPDRDPIGSLGMTVKNTLITDNNYGILVAGKDASNNIDAQKYSPIKIDGVHLGENLTVHDNKYGGALFNVLVVSGSKSSPGLTVNDSQFHRDRSDADSKKNNQDFGLRVNAYEGIFGVKISDSTFRYHNTISGAGIELLTPGTDEYYDAVEGVTIENTSSQYNKGPGLKIAANVVKDVDITSSGTEKAKFSGNDESGIYISGPDRVSDLAIKGKAGGAEILANYNVGYGLRVESKEEIYGVEVANAQFGETLNNNGNGNSGVKLATTGSEGDDIGAGKKEGAISFDKVEASGNNGRGIEVISAGSFINPSDNIFVNNSVFKENLSDGLYLYAAESVKRPRVEISTFLGNNITGGEAGIFIEADGEEIRGTGNGDIVGNTVANNEVGVVVYDPTDDTYVDTIIDFSVRGNTTAHPDDSAKTGNRFANLILAADNLNTVTVEDNLLISAYDEENPEDSTDYGLWLEANDSSASISINNNEFGSGAEGFCVGLGTAIYLDAKKTMVRQNKIDGFSTAVKVLKEDSGSSDAGDTSNNINKNDIIGCCQLIDASSLDYDNGEKVDARHNYWGEDMTKAKLKPNMKTDSENPWDQIFVEPLRDEPVGVLEDVTATLDVVTEDPKVGESVELDYDITNNTMRSKTVDAKIIVIDPDDQSKTILDTSYSISADSKEEGTATFTPDADGIYTAKITVKYDGEKSEDSEDIDVGGVEPPEPEDKEPYWGQDADAATSGILPAPIKGDEDPHLVLANADGDSVRTHVSVKAVRVFDRTGKRLLVIDDNFDEMTELESLNNDLYYYTVEYTLDGNKKTSPPMKFVVNTK